MAGGFGVPANNQKGKAMIAFVPVAAAETAVLFATSPALAVGDAALGKLFKRHSSAATAASDVLAGIGRGVTTAASVAVVSSSIAILPAAGIGAAVGGGAVVVWKVAKAAAQTLIAAFTRRWPERAMRLFAAFDRFRNRRPVRLVLDTLRSMLSANKWRHWTPSVSANAVAATSAAHFYLRRTAQTLSIRGFSLFTRAQLGVVTGAAILWKVGKGIWSWFKARKARKAAEAQLEAVTAALVDRVNAAAAKVEAQIGTVTDESIQALIAVAEELETEMELQVAPVAGLDNAAVSRINEVSAVSAAIPLVVPAVPCSTEERAEAMAQAVADLTAVANGEPLPQKQRKTRARR